MVRLFNGWADGIRRRLRARGLERRAQRLYQKGEYAEASAAYQEALMLGSERPLSLLNLGLALYKADRKTEARAVWERGLSLAEGRSVYLAEQIRILLRQFG